MSAPEPRLEDLVDFPAPFTFRVVGAGTDAFAASVVHTVQTHLGRDVAGHQVQPSAKGAWQSVRVRCQVHSADEIRAVYAALNALDGVRMLL